MLPHLMNQRKHTASPHDVDLLQISMQAVRLEVKDSSFDPDAGGLLTWPDALIGHHWLFQKVIICNQISINQHISSTTANYIYNTV